MREGLRGSKIREKGWSRGEEECEESEAGDLAILLGFQQVQLDVHARPLQNEKSFVTQVQFKYKMARRKQKSILDADMCRKV